MRVCFLEDTMLHGGTQIWVTEAALKFMEMGVDVTIPVSYTHLTLPTKTIV